MIKIYNIYENKYFNPLLLNLISVRYTTPDIIGNIAIYQNDYSISLNNLKNQCDNESITMKVFLYLCNLLTDTGLHKNTFIIYTNNIHKDLGIYNIDFFNKSLKYLSSITYDYKYFSKVFSTNIINTYEHKRGYFKVIFDNEFLVLLSRTRQFYQIPKELLKIEVFYFSMLIYQELNRNIMIIYNQKLRNKLNCYYNKQLNKEHL